MTRPFHEYFIATSHNTYLIEDLKGPASVDGYICALKRAARFIERTLNNSTCMVTKWFCSGCVVIKW